MDKEMLAYFGELLSARLKEITSVTRHAHACFAENAYHPEPMDDVDLASKRSDQQLRILIQSRSQQLVLEIQTALDRIKSGKFGMCEECGREIELKRLKAQPTTTLCIDCKKQMEIMERMERRKVA
jgi:DnaK suppressor protein